MTRFLGLTAFLASLALSGSVWAQGSEPMIEVHGFGGWAYGSTDGNAYTLGSDEGVYDNAQFSLHVVASPAENITIVAQMQFDNADDEVNLDYAFAEWFLSDALKLRFGRVKHPFGIYGEIFDVGTLRPFQFLPQGIYGGQGATAEAYNGVGLTGARRSGDRWGLQYDAYAGQITGTVEVPPGLSIEGGSPVLQLTDFEFNFDNVLGTRLNVLTPIEGLTVGLSGYYSSNAETALTAVPVPGFETGGSGQEVAGGHLEYMGGRTWVRAEAVRTVTASSIEQEAGYLELAYKLTPEWQVAARYESWQAALPGFDNPMLPEFVRQLADHQETALGLNYWVNSNLVLRLSVHEIVGNRFAFPSDPTQILQALLLDALDDTTQLVVFGTQFSF